MKKFLMIMVLLPLMAVAVTEEVDGITWTYTVHDGKAEIGNNGLYQSAIPSGTIGAITIPLKLGSCPVTSIGNYAFYGCSGLTSVTIPKGVTSIGESAFYNCSGLKSVTIPSSVTSIGDRVFSYCSGLNEILVDLENKSYVSFDGILYNKTRTELIRCPGGKTGSVTIPSSVTSIGSYAFYNCSGLTSVTIPSSVTSIGWWAFDGCSGLTSVTIPSSVTSIGQNAFYGCSEMRSVVIPSSVTGVGVNAFGACSKLEKIHVDSGDASRIKTMLSGVNVNALTFEEAKVDGAAVGRDKVQNEWYMSSPVRSNPTWVIVGDDEVDVDKVSYPYVFPSSGAVLNRTQGGYRLDLKGVLIKSEGKLIQANGDLSIYLEGENCIEADRRGGICLNSTSGTSHRLLIFGPGRLSILVSPSRYGIFAIDDISIMAGATVSIYGGENGIKSNSGSVLFSNCMIGVYGSSYSAIECNNLRILAAILSIQTTHHGVYARGDVVVDAAMANVFTPQNCMSCGNFYACHSYLALAATAMDDSLLKHSILQSSEASFDRCVAKLVGFASSSVEDARGIDITDFGSVSFGEGDYFIGLKAKRFSGNEDVMANSCGMFADTVILNGGNVHICSPGVSAVSAGMVDIECGMLEVQDEFDTAEMFKFDAGVVAGYTAAIGAGIFDASTASVDFYTQFFLDALSNGLMENIDGKASIAVNFGSGYYFQSGGTVLAEKSVHGILTDKYAAIVNGGSCHSAFQLSDVGKSGRVYYETAPCSVVGDVVNQNLKCVEYTVPGSSKYDKISRSWDGILPNYYGTQSLYADEGGKLYFWVSSSFGGGDSGGGNTSATHCTVTFDANGGTVSENNRKVVQGAAIGTLPTPAMANYKFLGWFTAAVGGTQVTAATVITKDVTFFAHWWTGETQVIVPGEKVEIGTGLIGYTASGLPSGLRYDKTSGMITGAATKPTAAEGAVVKFTKSGAETEELTIVVTAIPKVTVTMEGVNSPSDTDGCKVTGAGAYLVGKTVTLKATAPKGVAFVGWAAVGDGGSTGGLVAGGTTYSFTMGRENVALVAKFKKEVMTVECEALTSRESIPAGVLGAEGGIALDVATESGVKSVKVEKLPAGMKYDAKTGLITGAPTKAGDNKVVVTVTAKSGAVAKRTIEVKVAAMPTMATGTFDGFVQVGEANFGTLSLVATDAGRLTAKVVTASGKYSFSKTGWDSVADGVYCATLKTKKGDILALTLDSTRGWDANQLSGGFVTAEIAATKKAAAVPSRTYAVSAQRRAFGKNWHFAATGDAANGWTLAYVDNAKAAALTVTLKADGSTAAAGKLPNGTDAKGKAVAIKVSASGYANVGGMTAGAIIADFAPIVTVGKVRRALSIRTNLWFDRSDGHVPGAGEARIVVE